MQFSFHCHSCNTLTRSDNGLRLRRPHIGAGRSLHLHFCFLGVITISGFPRITPLRLTLLPALSCRASDQYIDNRYQYIDNQYQPLWPEY